jgi:ribosome recycling factor
MPNHVEAHKNDFQTVLEHYQKELQTLRTGRASVALVEGISVQAYGSSMSLKELASITTPDARTVQIEPWDKSVVKDLEKALVDASLGMQPNVAGTVIRMIMPPMTEEGRKNLVKVLHQKEEQTKIGVRNVREKIKTLIVDEEKAKTISEDERARQLEQLEKAVAEWNAKITEITKDKEEEIMTI